MELTIKLDNDFFVGKEEERLEHFFEQYDKNIEDALSELALAALREYKEMILGRGISSRAGEIQEYRLYYLFKDFFKDSIPSEADVAPIFQLTQPRSKTLIRSVLTKFNFELKDQIDTTIKDTLINDKNPVKAETGESMCKLLIPSDNIVDELNRKIDKLAKSNSSLERFRKYPNSARIYQNLRTSYEALCKELEITPPNYEDYKESNR